MINVAHSDGMLNIVDTFRSISLIDIFHDVWAFPPIKVDGTFDQANQCDNEDSLGACDVVGKQLSLLPSYWA